MEHRRVTFIESISLFLKTTQRLREDHREVPTGGGR